VAIELVDLVCFGLDWYVYFCVAAARGSISRLLIDVL
jgi:hypothetical protein